MARKSKSGITIGLISDTHGLLRPEATRALAGVQRIIHAGDIGRPEVLEQLRTIAPVDAVRGNNDKAPWAADIPNYQTLEIGGVTIHVLHDVNELDVDPEAAGIQVVVAGHSHRPAITRGLPGAPRRDADGVAALRDPVKSWAQPMRRILFVNPGSAGPRRFSLPVSIGFIQVLAGRAAAKILRIL
jgi:putative phosphoesterase